MPPSRRSPGDGSLFKRAADGHWVGQFSFIGGDGKRRRKSVSSKDRGECARKLRELRRRVDAGHIPTTANTTTEKWLTHWLETIAKPQIRPMTHKSYEQVIRLHIVPHIGRVKIDTLTAEQIRQMHRKIQHTSPRFAQLAHAVLRNALKQATAEGLIWRNPMEAVKPPKYTPQERKPFTLETATHLVATAFASRDESEATRWAAAFLLGERRGELLGLEWDRVNLDEGYIHLAWQLQRMKKDWKPEPGFEARHCAGTLWFTRPKSAAGLRNIPIYRLPPLLEALRRLKETDSDNPHGLVFHRADGHPISPEQHHKDWKALLETAGVEDAPLHSIRHTTAALLTKAGVPQDVRMMITGHSSVQAHQMYVHRDHADAAAALGNLSAIMPMRDTTPSDPRYSAVTALNYANETLGS